MNQLITWRASLLCILVLGAGAVQSQSPEASPDRTAEDIFQQAKAAYDTRDYTSAYRPMKLAADMGHPHAQFYLGLLYWDDENAPHSYREAHRYMKMAADQGVRGAQSNLGEMYRNGLGVEQNFEEAFRYYRMGRAQAEEQPREWETNVEASRIRALELFIEAKAAYDRGDYEAARGPLSEAASEGDAGAEVLLAMWSTRVQGESRMGWSDVNRLRRAAFQHYAPAQFELGLLYANGNGVPKDEQQAIRLLRLAASQGHAQAAETLRRLGR